MNSPSEATAVLRPIDLRGILQYVPMFRGHTFVVALDGSVLAGENLPDLLTDIAVLHSLNIKITLVHGTGLQLRQVADKAGHPVADPYGLEPTEDAVLTLAGEAAAVAGNFLQSQLTRAGLRFEVSNAIRATERGIIRGVDYLNSGRVAKIDIAYLKQRMEQGIIPVISPIAYNQDGKVLRLNSDETAADLAIQLEASKLLFLSRFPGLKKNGSDDIQKALALPELEFQIKEGARELDPSLNSKLTCALRAARDGVARVHILDGHRFGALLNEIFEKEGVGTMIHADDYQQIRSAEEKDLPAIASLVRQGADSDALVRRDWQSIQSDLSGFFVYEIDDFLIACANLTLNQETEQAELGTVYVHPVYRGRGVGRKMVAYAEKSAKNSGAHTLFALSTQNFSFFKSSGGFIPAELEELPKERQIRYLEDKRGGQILKKTLS